MGLLNTSENLEVFVQLDQDATLPAYATADSAGMDLCSTETVELQPLERRLVPTGVKMVIPKGYEGQVRPRSGLALRKGIALVNSPGTIDADYRGEIGVIAINLSNTMVRLERGERIAQLVICPVMRVTLTQVEDLDDHATDRGAGGFGSTGT